LATAVAVLSAAQVSQNLYARIPKPDRSKYKNITDAKNWHNPYLVVSATGVTIRAGSQSREQLAVESVVSFLDTLPDSAWPYGLVVAIQENGVQGVGDAAQIKRNRDRLLQELERAHIVVEPWPAA